MKPILKLLLNPRLAFALTLVKYLTTYLTFATLVAARLDTKRSALPAMSRFGKITLVLRLAGQLGGLYEAWRIMSRHTSAEN